MTAEDAEKKYNTPGGQFDVPEKLSLGDFDKTQKSLGADSANENQAGNEGAIIDGLFEKNDTKIASPSPVAESVETSTPADRAEQPKLDLASRLDPTKPMALLKLFGDLIITHEANTQMPDTRLDTVAKVALDTSADDDNIDSIDTYNGNEKTQEAFASVAKVVPRDSEIPDRLLQTLDRLNRQTPNSQTA